MVESHPPFEKIPGSATGKDIRNKYGLTPPKKGRKFTVWGSFLYLLISVKVTPSWQPIFKNNVYPF
jgi:hypothetical protein